MAIIIIRTLIIYFMLLLMMRMLGKRQLGEMELSEFVVAALVADLASHPLQDLSIPMINGIVPVLTLFCCEIFISWGAMKSVRLRGIFFGKPEILVKNGCIMQDKLVKNRFTTDELMQNLRNLGCMDISCIEYAILETDGRVNVIKSPADRPVTAGQMNISCDDGGYPITVISAGRVNEANLKLLALDTDWLTRVLAEKGIESPQKVFFMSVNDKKQCYISAMEERE